MQVHCNSRVDRKSFIGGEQNASGEWEKGLSYKSVRPTNSPRLLKPPDRFLLHTQQGKRLFAGVTAAFLAGFIVSERISFREDQDESWRREFCCRSHKIFLWPLVAGPLNKPGILYIGAKRVGKVTVVLSLG